VNAPRSKHHPERLPERQAFYDAMKPLSLTPLWESLHALVPPAPNGAALPHLWKFSDVRPWLMQAGQLITAHEAIRRVLILENPALPGSSSITNSLYAGLQLILPGEIAPSHRHTQSALRFVVEGSGAFTAVAGERTAMQPGDFIITPNWQWHDHGHELQSGEPVVWLDGLDIPMLRFFDAGFAENGSAEQQAVTRPEGLSFAEHGHNMQPVRSTSHVQRFGKTSPIFSYPYSRSREALHALERADAPDPAHAHLLRYTHPSTGGWPMPTLGTFLQRLPAGFTGQAHRQTDSRVFCVAEGSGRAVITRGEREFTFDFSPKDHFVVPPWYALSLQSTASCVLFSYSDRPVQEALGIHRQELL
jgi:gentisate 1,2-dioxygenase